MTATHSEAPASAGREPRKPRYQIPAELALGVVTLSVVFGFNRVFNESDYLGPLAVIAIYSHAVLAFTRRRGWGIALAGLAGLAGLVLFCTYLFFPGSTRLGLPSTATLDQVRAALSESWTTFQNVTAPAPAETGFLLACAVALFFAVFLADWAAFRLWSAWEAIVPATTLFIFCSLLGSVVNRIVATAVFLAAALGLILLHAIAKKEMSAGWLSSDIDRGSASLLRAGALLATCAALAGIVLGPHMPGSDSDPLLCWNKCAEGKGVGDRFTISPLVEIQSRLVEQANVELFTVESPNPAYWRMTSLDTFDGNSWRSKGKFTVADGDLDAASPPADNSLVEQKYRISGLARLWIPAAFQPVWVSPDAKARYQSDSSTLIVDTQLDTSDGLDYTVRSRIPSFTSEQLRNASTTIPEEIKQRYLPLPADFSTKARDAALAQTAGAQSAFEKARMLQDWFRGPSFTYNLKVAAGHGERAIDDFLDRREGYCEQFAGTFAAMARSLGIPSRVAVGFTWGDVDPDNPNLYRVRGEHAHAWPEVYLGEYGWVAFEPTPQRGAPNMQRWTEVAPGQANTDASSTTTSVPGTGTSVPPTAAPTSVPPSGAGELNTSSGAPVGSESETGSRVLSWGILTLVALAVLGATYVIAVMALRRSHHQRRRSRASDPSARVRVAWQESIEGLDLVGVSPTGAETNDEFATRAGEAVPETKDALWTLAHHTDAATYAAGLVDDETVTDAEHAATTIQSVVRDKTTSTRRLREALDPRPLWRRGSHAPRHTATSG